MTIHTSGSHPAMNMDEKVESYHAFLRLARFTIAILAIVLISMAFFLV